MSRDPLALRASKTEKAFRVAFSKFVMSVIGIWETTLKSQTAYGNSDSFNLRTRNAFLPLGIFSFFLQAFITFVSRSSTSSSFYS